MKLYDYPSCPYGQKVRIVLAEKGLSYELAKVDLISGDQRKPGFLRLNPFGKVPVLVDEDLVVYDSTIINEYLEDEYPQPLLLPPVEASGLRARARQFEDFADTTFVPQIAQLIAELAKPETSRDDELLARFRQSVERMLDYLNHELQGQHFLAGEFSVADVAFAPRILVLEELGVEIGPRRPNVEDWIKRIVERDSVRGLEGVGIEPVPGA